jgi:hypothetical protein
MERYISDADKKDAVAGEIIVNPGRETMPVEKTRELNPNDLVIPSTVEDMNLGNEMGGLIKGSRWPKSIDGSKAVPNMKRHLIKGGRIEMSVFGDPKPLYRELVKNGFMVDPPISVLVMATKP